MRSNFSTIRLLSVHGLIALATFALSACGGGGGSAPGPAASAAGVWQGASSSGYTLNLLVLPNNQFITVFGTSSNGALSVAGFDAGGGTISGNTLSGALTEFNAAGQRFTGRVSAAVTTGQSIVGSASYSNGGNTTFSLTPLTAYTYNTAANLATISGAFNGALLNGGAASVTVSGNGTLTGTSGSCSFTGTVMPEPSGVNVFDVAITFGGSPCLNAGQTQTGYGLAYTTSAGTTQLIVAVTASDASTGNLFFAQR